MRNLKDAVDDLKKSAENLRRVATINRDTVKKLWLSMKEDNKNGKYCKT